MLVAYGVGCLLMAVASMEMNNKGAKVLAAMSSMAFFLAFFSYLINGN